MQLKWGSQRAFAKSGIVKTSAIWLIVVPLAAKTLSSLDDVIDMTIFGGLVSVTTALPFAWQLLFIAAVCFTIAGIVFSVFCPEIIKKYNDFSQFESEGKTRLQINSALKAIAWNSSEKKFNKIYTDSVSNYFYKYNETTPKYNDVMLNEKALSLLEDVSGNSGKNSNAFYHVYDLSNMHGQLFIWTSLVFYMAGFICIGIIALQNICYVYGTFDV